MMIRKYLASDVDGQGAGPQRSRCSNSRGQEACEFDKEKGSSRAFARGQKTQESLILLL